MGLVTNGEVEDYSDPIGTLPVTLSYFEAVQQGDLVHFEWSTSTEVRNAGFNLYAQTDTGRQMINTKLIFSQGSSSLDRQDYSYDASVEGKAFFLEEVSVQGNTEVYGPFELGEAEGDRSQRLVIDWSSIQAEYSALEVQRDVRDAAKVNQKLQQPATDQLVLAPNVAKPVKPTSTPVPTVTPPVLPTSQDAPGKPGKPTRTPRPMATPSPTSTTPAPPTPTPITPTPSPIVEVAYLEVNQTGLYRVTYEALAAAGFNLASVPAGELALTNRGVSVPIRVVSGSSFGPGSYLEFYGQGLDTIYTDTNVYVLWRDQANALRAVEDSTAPDLGVVPPAYYMETTLINNQNNYDFGAPGSDPWYDSFYLVYRNAPESVDSTITLDNLVSGPSSTLKVKLWGLTDFRSSTDHHVVVKFNGVTAADQWFDGFAAPLINAPLASNIVQDGVNVMTIALPADLPSDVAYDMMELDYYSITYPRAFVARTDGLTFTAAAPVFQVVGLQSSNVVAYRLTNGSVTFLSGVHVSGGLAAFPGAATEATYIVSAAENLKTPTIKPVRQAADINTGAAEYLVIAHPNFINADLARLVQARTSQGLTVKVVDVRDIYARYNHGIFDAAAIHNYIKFAAANLGTQYVLLVGGDTYDYRNYTGVNSISFIPSLYRATNSIVLWAPVDPLYADINGNNVPDLAIGRFPVRTTAELANIVDKTLAYTNKTYGGSAVFAADQGFGAYSNGFITTLPAGWSTQKAHLDELDLAGARAALIDTINGGVAMTTYVGHSDDWEWTRLGLFDTGDAELLTNFGKPTIVTQWGCWNTYYVSPSYNTMGHILMLTGNNGAAAVLGATTLSYDAAELALGNLLTPKLAQPGMTIGAAITAAKAELALTRPNATDVILGWTLLGDPYLMVHP